MLADAVPEPRPEEAMTGAKSYAVRLPDCMRCDDRGWLPLTPQWVQSRLEELGKPDAASNDDDRMKLENTVIVCNCKARQRVGIAHQSQEEF